MTKRRDRNHDARRQQRDAIVQRYAALDGAHIPGGCDTCNAEQIPQVLDTGLVGVTVMHETTCPTYEKETTA